MEAGDAVSPRSSTGSLFGWGGAGPAEETLVGRLLFLPTAPLSPVSVRAGMGDSASISGSTPFPDPRPSVTFQREQCKGINILNFQNSFLCRVPDAGEFRRSRVNGWSDKLASWKLVPGRVVGTLFALALPSLQAFFFVPTSLRPGCHLILCVDSTIQIPPRAGRPGDARSSPRVTCSVNPSLYRRGLVPKLVPPDSRPVS